MTQLASYGSSLAYEENGTPDFVEKNHVPYAHATALVYSKQ